jgi:very-short-patch-repair endonuclease
MTPPEVRLWNQLKGRQIGDMKFRRQYSVGPYILDFYCPALKLAIEVDGESHCMEPERDALRQARIEAFGIRFLRFTNREVMEHLESVVEVIQREVEVSLSTSPAPPC